MEPKSNFHGLSMDEIIFDDRNKAYGAFILRKNYQKNQKLALMVCVSVFVLVMVSPRLFRMGQIPLLADTEKMDTVICPLLPPTIIDPPKEQGGASSKKDMEYKPVDETLADTASHKNEERKNAITGTTNSNGNDSGLFVGPKGKGNENDEQKQPKFKPTKSVELMPEFIGGIEAMKAFIEENKKPEVTENGEEGRVLVGFTVDESGYVGNVIVVKSSGNRNLDIEAMRLIKIQPRYKPGTVNGVPIKMLCEIPIEFIEFDD